jgi:putative thioredoxin
MDVTEETFFAEVVEQSKTVPVVVDFWADWCGPCRMLTPALEQAVAKHEGDVVLAKVDIDANPGLAERFGIRSIPAVKGFKDGQVVDEFVGVRSPHGVETFLEALLGPSQSTSVLDELTESGEFPEVLGPLAEGDHERALEWLLAQIPEADADRRERIRETMVALFAELGQQHPLSLSYRRRLATALY